MRHPEFPVVSFLMVPLLISSLPSHIRARSVSTTSLMVWLVVLNIIRGVNSLVWANNIVIRLEVWCDITTKTLIGFTFAVPLSALCICRHLELVSSNRQAIITLADRHRRMKLEAVMCIGLPLIFMALHYVVQGHRFDVIEDVGCHPSTYFSVPALMIVWIPPLVISLISLIYAVAAFHHFLQRRIEFAAILQSSNSAITPGRYFRLMALAIFEILWDSGTNICILYFNTFTGLRPWISWENVHSNFSRVGIFPAFLSPPWALSQLVWQWWIIPISSIAFFIFFGFGEEAMSDYRAVFTWFGHTIFNRRSLSKMSATTTSLPFHRPSIHSGIHVNLPASSDTNSQQDFKPWDNSSMQSPEKIAHFVLASRTDLAAVNPISGVLRDGDDSILSQHPDYHPRFERLSRFTQDSLSSTDDSEPHATSEVDDSTAVTPCTCCNAVARSPSSDTFQPASPASISPSPSISLSDVHPGAQREVLDILPRT